MTAPMRPCWDMQSEQVFLATPAEKQAIRGRPRGSSGRLGRKRKRSPEAEVHVPLTAFLRPGNLVGGGFSLSASERVPAIVRDYVASVLSGDAPA